MILVLILSMASKWVLAKGRVGERELFEYGKKSGDAITSYVYLRGPSPIRQEVNIHGARHHFFKIYDA